MVGEIEIFVIAMIWIVLIVMIGMLILRKRAGK